MLGDKAKNLCGVSANRLITGTSDNVKEGAVGKYRTGKSEFAYWTGIAPSFTSNKNTSTITTTYNTKPAKYPRSLEKKMLDKALTPCYNIYITIEKERKE